MRMDPGNGDIQDHPRREELSRNHPRCPPPCRSFAVQNEPSKVMTKESATHLSDFYECELFFFFVTFGVVGGEAAPVEYVKDSHIAGFAFSSWSSFSTCSQLSFQRDWLWHHLKRLEGVRLFVHFRCKMVTFLPFTQLTLCIKAAHCSVSERWRLVCIWEPNTDLPLFQTPRLPLGTVTGQHSSQYWWRY